MLPPGVRGLPAIIAGKPGGGRGRSCPNVRQGPFSARISVRDHEEL